MPDLGASDGARTLERVPRRAASRGGSESTHDLTIVTHRALPEGAPDDRLLAAALRGRGMTTRFAPWDAPAVDWTATSLAVVRSAWDYHHDPRRWSAWIEAVSCATTLLNPPDVLRWSSDKRYLLDLMRLGVACVPTEVVLPDAVATRRPEPLAAVAARRGWSDVVVKPAIAASAFGARRFAGDALARDGEAHLRALASREPAFGAALVQPYLAAVERVRERSLVFIDGAFTHAFTKPAFSTGAAGGTVVEPHQPSADELQLAAAALAAAPSATLYARIDLIPDARGPLVTEVELVEPDLALRLSPDATERLAAASLARCDAPRSVRAPRAPQEEP